MNLQRVMLDLDDGKLKAIPDTGNGGGGGNGFSFNQTIPSYIWNVNHGLGNLDLIYNVYDSLRESIIPDTFKVINANNVQVTFSVPQTGYLVLLPV